MGVFFHRRSKPSITNLQKAVLSHNVKPAPTCGSCPQKAELVDEVRTLATVFCLLPGAFALPGTLRTSSPGVTSGLSLQFVSFLILREASSFFLHKKACVCISVPS